VPVRGVLSRRIEQPAPRAFRVFRQLGALSVGSKEDVLHQILSLDPIDAQPAEGRPDLFTVRFEKRPDPIFGPLHRPFCFFCLRLFRRSLWRISPCTDTVMLNASRWISTTAIVRSSGVIA